MPLYEIQGPDGKLYEIEGPAGATKDQIVEAIQTKLANRPAPKEGLGAALVGGTKRALSTGQTAVESLFDPEGAARRGLEREEEISAQYAPAASLEKVKQAYATKGLFPAAGEVISQVPGAVVEQAPNIAATLGGARLGAMAGAPLGPIGALVGGLGGAALPSLIQLFGSNIQRQAEEGQDISRAAALGAAVPGAALETAATFVPLGRTLVGKILGPNAEKALTSGASKANARLVEEGLARTLIKGAGVGALAEIPTEVTQQMLERLQAGLPLTSDEAFAEYGEAAYGAGLVGAPFGAVGRVGQRSLARGKAAEEKAEEQRLQEQIAEEERKQIADRERAAEMGAPLFTADEATMGDTLVGPASVLSARAGIQEKEAQERATLQAEFDDQNRVLAQEIDRLETEASNAAKAGNTDVAIDATMRLQQMRKAQEQLKESAKEQGLNLTQARAPTLDQETKVRNDLAKAKKELAKAGELGDFDKISKLSTKVKTLEEALAEQEQQLDLFGGTNQARVMAEQAEAEKEAKRKEAEVKQREKGYEEAQKGIQNYLAGLDEIEQINDQEVIKRLAQEQQKREEDIAQEMTLDRIDLLLKNFGLRAAGVTPEVRKQVESKIDEGTVDRTVTRELGIAGLEGRTYRGEEAAQVLPNIEAAIDKLEEQRQKITAAFKSTQEKTANMLMDDKGQLTPAGYKLVANEAKLNELKRLRNVIQGRAPEETGVESGIAGTIKATTEAATAPVAVDVKPNMPTLFYTNKANESQRQAQGSFLDLTSFMDDYRKGRFFGPKGAKRDIEFASSTRESLLQDTEEARRGVIRNLIDEVSYRRYEQGLRPLTRDEAIKLAFDVDAVLGEIVTRGTALPSGYFLEDVEIIPAQMRGTEIVQEAKTQLQDVRKLKDRQFGAPRRAMEVLAEMIKQAKEEAVKAGKRPVSVNKPLLRQQFTTPETDVVQDLKRVLDMKNIQPDVRSTLEQAQRRMEEGGASEALEDLVKEQVGRILRGTDKPFTLEYFKQKDVTKPGGKRNMEMVGTAQLIDEIKTQLRFDSDAAGFAEGEQRTVVPSGEGFKEVDVQPDLFPETRVTERATPGQFRRLQQSAGIRRERERIAKEKKEAEKAKPKLAPLAKRIGELEQQIENLQPLNTANLKFVQEKIADIEKKLGKRSQIRILKGVLGERYDNLSDRLDAMDKAVAEAIPQSEADLKVELQAYSKELKKMLAQAKKEAGMRKELEVLKERRAEIIQKAEGARPYVESAADKLEKQRSAVAAALEKAVTQRRQEVMNKVQELNKQLTFLHKRIRGLALNRLNSLKTLDEKKDFIKQAEREVLLGINYLAESKYASYAKGSAVAEEFLNATKNFKPTLFPKEIARINKLAKELDAVEVQSADSLALLDSKFKAELARAKVLEKQVAKEAEGTPEEKEAKRKASVARAEILKAQDAVVKEQEENRARAAKIKQVLTEGLDLPGIRGTAKTSEEMVVEALQNRKEAKEDYKKELAKWNKLSPEQKKETPKPVKAATKRPARVKVVPLKSKSEVQAEAAERLRENLDDIRRRAAVTSPESMYDRLKEERKVANEDVKVKSKALKDFAKSANLTNLQQLAKDIKAKKVKISKNNFEKLKELSIAVDKAKAKLKDIDDNLKLLQATQYDPEKVKRQPSRGVIGGDIKQYDKKFTPEQLNEMSNLGVSVFTPKTYSVDDSIDFAIGENEGGNIDLEEANARMAEVKKKLPSNIKFVYFPTMGDVTADVLKEMNRQGLDIYTTRVRGGVKPDGTVFVIGANHTDMRDLEKTVAHEFVGHYTFEGLLGPGGMRALLKQVESSFGSVFKLATQLGVYDDAVAAFASAKKAGLPDAEANLKALREVVAYTMEKRVDQDFLAKAKRWLQEMVGAVRAALRKMGMAIDLSTSDLFYLMKQANDAFSEGKPVAYKKNDGTVDFALTKPKFNAGFEDVAKIAAKVVGSQEGMWDGIKANTTGLTARVQFVDRFAALEALTKQGVVKGIIDSLKAFDIMYFARMADQRHAFVAEIASNGTLKMKVNKRADGQVERLIQSERGANLKDVSIALKDAAVGDAKATGDLFTLYLAAERAEAVGIDKLNYSGKITEADLKKVLALGRNENTPTGKAFQKARKIYNEYNRGLIDFAVESGAIGKEKGEALKRQGDYIPYYRKKNGVVELMIGSETPVRIGDLKSQPYLQELVGGDEAIMDFFTSALQNTTLLTDMALRNLATRNAAFGLRDLGIAEIRTGDGPPSPNVIRFSMDEVDKETKKVKHVQKYAIINVEAKKEVFGDIPSDLVVKGMEGIQLIVPGVVRALAAPANWLRKFVTRDPRYAVRQIFRDSLAAALTTGADVVPVVDTMGEILKMYGKGGSKAFETLQRSGVLGGQVFTGAPEDMSKIMQQLASGKVGWDLAMAKLDQWAMAGDAGTRIAMYNSFLKQGLSEREAIMGALESMNFGRRGVSPSIYFLNATIPFFNAGIQGIDVLYRAFKGDMPNAQKLQIQKKLLIRGGTMAMLTMAYAMMMQDDEAYKNAPPEQRYGNWFIRIPGIDEPFRVPIPFELGLIFKALPEGIYNAAFGTEEGTKVAKDLTMQLLRSLPGNPAEAGVPMPTAVKPFIETALNTSFFTGRDIVDARMEGLDKAYQYRDKTPEILKILGPAFEAVGLSPVQVENIIRGYTGTMGIGIASVIMPISTSQAGGIEKRVSDMPLVGGLFQPNDAGRVIDEAYDSMKDVQRAMNTYKKLIEEGRLEDAKEYLDDNVYQVSASSFAGSFRQRMGEITKAERAIKAAPTEVMSPEEKRKELDELRKIKIDLSDSFRTTLSQITRQAAP